MPDRPSSCRNPPFEPSAAFQTGKKVLYAVFTYGFYVVAAMVIIAGVTQLLPWKTALLSGLAAAFLVGLSPFVVGFWGALELRYRKR
jgi:hypothetical protein